MTPRILQSLCALALLVILLLGCGGGGNKSAVVNPISGTITTPTYTIPAGETRTVVGNLTVNAGTGITIDGTLLVQPGVDVALLSDGDVNVNGTIGTAAGVTLTRGAIDYGDPHAIVLAGENVQLIDPAAGAGKVAIDAGPGYTVDIATTTDTGKVKINGDIRMADSPDQTEDTEGVNGGSIYIGNAIACAAAEAKGKVAAEPGAVYINANLRGGKGGNGKNAAPDCRIENGKKVCYAFATDGGNGGNIVIYAKSFVAMKAGVTVTAGKGGNGGGVGTAAAPLHAPDGAASGTAAATAGYELITHAGGGGAGGSISFQNALLDTVGTPGNGGNAGNIYASAGNGGAGGAGGMTLVTLRHNGRGGAYTRVAGSGTTYGADAAAGTVSTVVLANGGNGGNGSLTTLVDGGNGGYVEFTPSNTTTATLEVDRYAAITISNYSNGGNGAACPHVGVHVAGGKGGTHEQPTLWCLTSGQPNVTITNSFNGGNGSIGTPLGTKGLGGTDKNSVKLGSDGTDGTACPAEQPPSIAETEPNDTAGQATPMGSARIATGRLSSTLDQDHFRVTLTPGTYSFVISDQLGWMGLWVGPGAGISVVEGTMRATVTLAPSATSYDVVWGVWGGSGPYTVTITKLQ
jgi:hypothetical protein